MPAPTDIIVQLALTLSTRNNNREPNRSGVSYSGEINYSHEMKLKKKRTFYLSNVPV